ncbi:MAG TPA: neutral zinc metallopeptidase [Flavobacterium sp.]|jgi:hypothetical protein
MKWMGRRESSNMEDRRGMSGGKMAAGGGLIAIVVVIINMFMGGDSAQLLQQIQTQPGVQTEVPLSEEDQRVGSFVRVIQADTEEVWRQIFSDLNMTYEDPGLVLFRDATNTGCGSATAASGPFYCPADRKMYMDMAFFDELQSRFGAQGGDFAVAYVIAHEIGHHVQTLLGTSEKVRRMQQGMSEAEANKLSVALELQADFYAGLWTHYSERKNKMLEPGDIEEALSAANAVGDDAIQRKTTGTVDQDSFTHGTSEQRMYWFNKGFTTGDIRQGDTFAEIR